MNVSEAKMMLFYVSSFQRNRCTNLYDNSIPVTGDRKKGVTIIKYKRPLKTFDPNFDTNIPSDQAVSVIGAIGPLNSQKEANAHSHTGSDVNADNIEINFSVKVNI